MYSFAHAYEGKVFGLAAGQTGLGKLLHEVIMENVQI